MRASAAHVAASAWRAWPVIRANSLRVTGELKPGLAEYERSRLKGARLTGRVAGSEMTDKHSRILGLTSDALITRFHTRWLRMVSTILNE